MIDKQILERKLRQSVNGALFMTSTEFGRVYGISAEKAEVKLKRADIGRSGTYWFIPDIVAAIVEKRLQ